MLVSSLSLRVLAFAELTFSSTVAYTSSIPSNGSEFASGLLLKVKSSSVQDMGFLLVGYSFSDCQHTLEELSGMEHFARDIRVGLDKL